MLLITTFVELRVVAGRNRKRAGHPIQSYTCHAMPIPRCTVALRSRFQNGMVVAWHGRGVACVNQTQPHCVNQMGKTQSKHIAARHGRRMAWERHGMCELDFTRLLASVTQFRYLSLNLQQTYPCLRWNSNPQSQKTIGRRPTA
jgi:hypothetical protein